MKRSIAACCFGFLVVCLQLWPQAQTIELDPHDEQETLFTGYIFAVPPHLIDQFGIPIQVPPQAPPFNKFIYQEGCQIQELSGSDASASASGPTKVRCVPAKMSQLNIKVENPQDLPSGELAVNLSYFGLRTRISGDAEVRESIRFHLGRSGISEGGAAHANILDFASDPVLSRTVKLGLLEIIVDENHEHHTLGRLVVRGEPNFARFTNLLQHEPGVNEIDSIGIPMEGALPVASEYQSPERLYFVPEEG